MVGSQRCSMTTDLFGMQRNQVWSFCCMHSRHHAAKGRQQAMLHAAGQLKQAVWVVQCRVQLVATLANKRKIGKGYYCMPSTNRCT